MKIASSGGIPIMEGLEEMSIGSSAPRPKSANLPPLPTLQTRETSLAAKALLSNLEEGGGLTSDQAAVIRRVVAAGDRNRRKLVGQLSLIVAKGTIAESVGAMNGDMGMVEKLKSSAETAGKALERLRIDSDDDTRAKNPPSRSSCTSPLPFPVSSPSRSSFNFEVGAGNVSDSDSDDGIPLICIQSESNQSINNQPPRPQPPSFFNAAEKRNTSPILQLSISPGVSRASSISALSSNETDDSLKFTFPIVKPALQGPIEEEFEEESPNHDDPVMPGKRGSVGGEVPTIVIEPQGSVISLMGGRHAAVFDATSPSHSPVESRQSSVNASSMPKRIPSRQSSMTNGSYVNLTGAQTKPGKLSALDDDHGRSVCIDDEEESNSSGSSSDSDPEPSRGSKPTGGRPEKVAALKEKLGLSLKIDTKVKRALELPTAKRKRGSPTSALKMYRNPKSPNARKKIGKLSWRKQPKHS
ncbi:hypothetical protein BC829DRAFT_47723 [Chytridium lagenaria]|nr:hypothetical protein BC829DRAFT_47723 [Chytridium lagenaria]